MAGKTVWSLVNTCQAEPFRDDYRTHYKALYKCSVYLLIGLFLTHKSLVWRKFATRPVSRAALPAAAVAGLIIINSRWCLRISDGFFKHRATGDAMSQADEAAIMHTYRLMSDKDVMITASSEPIRCRLRAKATGICRKIDVIIIQTTYLLT